MQSLKIWLPIVPPTITAQQKGAKVISGRRVMFYEKPEVRAARLLFERALSSHIPDEPLDGIVTYSVDWIFPWLKKHNSNRNPLIPMDVAPDLDNLNKLLFDVLGSSKFFVRGDQQMSGGLGAKYYGEYPGIALRLKECHSLIDMLNNMQHMVASQLWFLDEWEEA